MECEDELIECIAFLPDKLKEHLIAKGEKLPPDFLSKIKSLYKRKCNTPHLFLSSSSSLSAIPAGQRWRTSSECVYLRPAMLPKSSLMPSTLELLDKSNWLLLHYNALTLLIFNAAISKGKKMSRSRLTAIKSTLTLTPTGGRLRRIQTRGPGSASRIWCMC